MSKRFMNSLTDATNIWKGSILVAYGIVTMFFILQGIYLIVYEIDLFVSMGQISGPLYIIIDIAYAYIGIAMLFNLITIIKYRKILSRVIFDIMNAFLMIAAIFIITINGGMAIPVIIIALLIFLGIYYYPYHYIKNNIY